MLVAVVAACCLVAGCAGNLAHREGLRLLADGHDEAALAKLEEATKAAPGNVEYRLRFITARERVVARLMGRAQAEREAGRVDEAAAYYRRVQALEPAHRAAAAGLSGLALDQRHGERLSHARKALQANDAAAALSQVAAILNENPAHGGARAFKREIDERLGQGAAAVPMLGAEMRRSISIEVRDANIKQLIEALSRDSGLNFILDREIPPNLTVTTFLRNVAVEEALDVILSTYQLQKRVLNSNTVLIYPNTGAKQTEFQDLVVKGIYLANANAGEALNMLKSVLKIKNAHVDEKLNLLILREPPETIRLAERMVAMLDVGEPEVMLEVEVLEVTRSRLTELGVKLPDQLTLSPLPSDGSTVTLYDLAHLDSRGTAASISSAMVNLRREVGDTNLLANPRIRSRSKEKALIRIGDRVPLITTTTTATGLVSENVQYVDVGLKLEVEPTVYLDDEVAIKLDLEVSSVVRQLVSPTGSVSYQIGTRNAGTVIRLRDGETQVLGGLINDEDRKTANRFPGLGDLPIVGRLFSSQKNDDTKTELVLSITPRLVRGVLPPGDTPTEFWSGTEAAARIRPLHTIVDGTETIMQGDASPATAEVSRSTDATAMPPVPMTTLAGTASVALRWSGDAQGKVGDTVKLEVRASAAGAVTSLPLQVKYDPAVLELLDVTPAVPAGGAEAPANFKKHGIPASGLLFATQEKPALTEGGGAVVMYIAFKARKAVERTVVALLPTTPSGLDGQALAATAPALFGIGIAP
ncbi:secretin N-terminal domain-containing protein [Pseudothauera rhizosphaerae]|nr:secretin N-terminal domain-containing protein [Pseudothauera rhizosphaerae]